MIVDEAHLTVKAGRGGSGSMVFQKRSDAAPRGWGGDGGEGGSVFFSVSPHFYDLHNYRYPKRFKAPDGKNGLPNNKTGRCGDDCLIPVPRGVIVRSPDGGLIVDLNEEGAEYRIVRGGKGGRGNYRRQFATEGEEGEEKTVVLDYRIPVDVALLGPANAGKTALFNVLSGKEYKVAAYPYTTHSCVWAPVEYEFKRIVLMDTPALCAHSHEGKGLGNRFLKHLYRTKVLLITSSPQQDVRRDFDEVKEQLRIFGQDAWQGKKIFYLLTKTDTIKDYKKGDYLSVSAHTGYNIEALKKHILEAVFGP